MIRRRKILPQLAGGGGPRTARWRGSCAGLRQPLHHAALRRGSPPLGIDGRNGFTLVELMVVILIIGLLATIVIINVMPATDQAAVTKARADIATLESGVEMYRLKHMNYPSGGNGLQLLVEERLIKRLPKDPWGNSYRYSAPGRDGRDFEIISYGADGREGGEDEDADIASWD